MNKFITLCAGAILFGAPPVSAQTFTPMGTYLITGPVTVSRGGINISCTLNVTLTVAATPSSTASAVPQLQPGAIFCPTFTFTSTPYAVTYNVANATISMSGVVIGSCSGTVTGAWNNSSKILTLNATLPGGCTINGQLTAPSSLEIY